MLAFIARSMRISVTAIAFAVCAFAVTTASAADKFPDHTIQVVIHAKYGGGTDTTARMMMIRARRILGVDMQVVAKRGGSGSAAQAYANSRPKDGYTLVALTQTHLYTIARGKSEIGIDDLVGVARAMNDPTFITVPKNSPYKTIEDLVKASKDHALNWGVAQIGNTEHIGLAQLAKAAGFKFKVVPFGSGAQMVQALMSGAIDATLPNVSEAKTQIENGDLRALLVIGPDRLKDFPNVPSAYEKGWHVSCSTTRGYAVLKGTPADRVKILSDALVKSMHGEAFSNYLKSSGLTPDESIAGHDVWDKQLKEEYAKAKESLKELGLIK